MHTVKINNTSYNVPEIGFRHMAMMESIIGDSVILALQKEQAFLISEAFVSMVVGCNTDEADRLLEQHVLGGGRIDEIVESFVSAAKDSAFFRKLLNMEEEKPKKATTSKQQKTE